MELSLETLQSITQTFDNYDLEVMYKIANTCLRSKAISYWAVNNDDSLIGNYLCDTLQDNVENRVAILVVEPIRKIADFANNRVEIDAYKD